MHLEVISQLLIIGPDAATTSILFKNGLKIQFYLNLTPKVLSSRTRSQETFPFVRRQQCKNKKKCFFLAMVECFFV